MKKFTLCVWALTLLVMDLNAKEVNALVLHLVSGKQVVCLLEEQPLISFTENELVLTTHLDVVTYQAGDVRKITYINIDPSSIDLVDMPQHMFSITGGMLAVQGLEPDSEISIFASDGKLVVSTRTDENGTASVVLPNQNGGVFMVKTSIANFKISKP